jgi:CzcA family heavy metal efflux pump
MVSERLAEAATQMPQGVHNPAMAPLIGATSLTLIVGLTSEQASLMDLRTFADWTMRPRLLGVPGVARISLFGGEVKQLQIQLLPDRMAAFHVSFTDVVAAARNVTGVRGAGFIETDAQRVVLETEGQMLAPAKLENAVISVANGHSVRLKDVAVARAAAEPKFGDATIMGKPGVLILISGVYGANTLEVTQNIEAALDELKPGLQGAQIHLYPDLFRPANFVNTAVHNIGRSLLIGAVLVSIVLLFFLFNLRVAFISLTAIPLSLLSAIIILNAFGESLNTLTLGGLAIAIGEVVDDAIIDAENIFRRLREAPRPLSSAQLFLLVRNASIEVRSAVVYATFVVVLVFVPVVTMSGAQGRLFAPLAWTYIIAILASLLVALTVTPALSYLLLPSASTRAHEPSYVLKLTSVYGRTLRSISEHPWILMGGASLLFVAALAVLPFLGGEFLPEMREGHFIVHTASLPGTSLRETARMGTLITGDLLKNPDVRLVAQQIGRAEQGDDTWGVHYSEIHVDLKPVEGEAAEKTEEEIRQAVARFPGLSVSINPFLAERMAEVISGMTSDVVVSIYGDDLDMLDHKAREIADVMATVPGATDVQIPSPPGTPQIAIRLRTDRLLEFGFQPVTVLEAVQAAYQGATVAQTYEGNRVFDVNVVLAPQARQNPEQIGSLMLQNAEGGRVPLRELAEIESASGRYSIDHEGTRRRQVVVCNVRNRDLTSFVADARRSISGKIQFSTGYYPVFSGASEARSQAQQEILTHSLIAGAGIVILLSIAMHSFRNLLLVLANVPFALVGGVLAAALTGGNISIGSLVGFVTLFGITTNSIMMISHFEHLVTQEGEAWGMNAVVRGASERLTPVLMTATVTALGLLPLALGSGQAGREIEGPMAIVILGGLVTSTVLNLVVLPAMALRFAKFDGSPET